MQMPWHKFDVFRACRAAYEMIVALWYQANNDPKLSLLLSYNKGHLVCATYNCRKWLSLKLHRMEFNARRQEGWDVWNSHCPHWLGLSPNTPAPEHSVSPHISPPPESHTMGTSHPSLPASRNKEAPAATFQLGQIPRALCYNRGGPHLVRSLTLPLGTIHASSISALNPYLKIASQSSIVLEMLFT